ncbi:MAG: hypothetical protein IPP80_14485 [Ignavibacteria bacterium]|nr:hypothetical protein [Ignavibacteria bacterium]
MVPQRWSWKRNTTFTGEGNRIHHRLPSVARAGSLPTIVSMGTIGRGYVGWMIQTQSNATGVGTVGIRT